MVCHSADDIKVTLLQKMELSYKLLAMTWINSRSMVLIDTSERAHLVDVKSEEEVQVDLDLLLLRILMNCENTLTVECCDIIDTGFCFYRDFEHF